MGRMTGRLVGLLLAGAALAAAGSARAAVATRSFAFSFDQFRSGFGNVPPPIETLNGTLTVTTNYAPDGTGQVDQLPDAFRLVLGSRTFTEADVTFDRTGFTQGIYLSFQYAVTPNTLNLGTYDFGMGFRYDEGLGARFGQLTYAVPGSGNYFTSVTGLVTELPEPATWAMLVGGFGAAGAALRVRRRGSPATA